MPAHERCKTWHASDRRAQRGRRRERQAGSRRAADPFARIALFIRQVITELKKVVTPTRKELFSYTAVVLVFVIIMMAIVCGLDWCSAGSCCASSERRVPDRAARPERPAATTLNEEKKLRCVEDERHDVDWPRPPSSPPRRTRPRRATSLEHESFGRPHRDRAVHLVEDEGNDIDLDAVLDALEPTTDPEADAVVDDALEIDSDDEAARRRRGDRRRRPRTSSTPTRSSAPSCAASRASGTSSTPTPASRSA